MGQYQYAKTGLCPIGETLSPIIFALAICLGIQFFFDQLSMNKAKVDQDNKKKLAEYSRQTAIIVAQIQIDGNKTNVLLFCEKFKGGGGCHFDSWWFHHKNNPKKPNDEK